MHKKRVEMLLRRSERFLEDAFRALEDSYYDLAIFYSGQAAQLALKALMLDVLGFYPEIHGIRELLGLYYKATGDEEAKALATEARKVLAEMERAYTEARYGPEEYDEGIALESLKVARELVAFVKSRIHH